MNDNDYEMQVEDLIKAEEIKYEVVLVFPYFSHDSTALCYTEGATQQNTQYRLPAEQWWAAFNQEKATTVLLVADIVCSAGSRLQCNTTQYCHEKNKENTNSLSCNTTLT